MTLGGWIWLAIGLGAGAAALWFGRWMTFRDRRSSLRSESRLEPVPADDPERGRPRPWIITNPSKHEDPHAFREEVNALALDHGISHVHWIDTTTEDPGVGQTLRALDLGASVVIAAGGDGTVRAVASAMAHSGVRMGILPQGTGNLLARNLGLPIDDLASALGVALGEHHRVVDLAWLRVDDIGEPAEIPAEGELLAKGGASSIRTLPANVSEPAPDEYAYVVIAGLGFDGETMANTDPTLKKKVGWVAYVLSALTAIRAYRMRSRLVLHGPISKEKSRTLAWADIPPARIGILEASTRGPITGARSDPPAPSASSDPGGPEEAGAMRSLDEPPAPPPDGDEVAEFTARTVLFANCGELPYIVLAPDATLDDGLLDVIAVDTQAGILGWADLAQKILFQGAGVRALNMPASTGQIAFRQAVGASVTVDEPQIVQIDGDAIGTARTVHVRVDHNALDIGVPER